MKILDCTLRDGGYYNAWDFDASVVSTYLKAVADARIDYVELGLRNFAQAGFLGPFAYTTEAYLNTLTLPDGPIYGAMVDAKTILTAGLPIAAAVDALFVPKSQSKLGLVRIAAHFHEVEQSREIAQHLKSLGYIVGFNLMQAGGKPDALITQKAACIKEWGCVDALYFADSLGNMDTTEVARIVAALRQAWDGELGIHTHNNMAKALDNTLHAHQLGVTWLDVTITGMGRGAGNAQTENLLAVLSLTSDAYNPAPIYDLVVRHFEKMQKHYGWGSSLLYFIGAQHNVHPTYVQNLLSDNRYGPDEIVGAIDYLSKADASSYDGRVLEKALKMNQVESAVSGSLDLKNRFAQKEVLIIGRGPSVQRYLPAIENYINTYKPIVLAINLNPMIAESLVDGYVISHNVKFLADKNHYTERTKPFVLPKHRFSAEEMAAFQLNAPLWDYGLQVQEGVFAIDDTHCTIPSELTAAYAIAAAINAGASSIKLVGFDGYEKGDKRQEEMVNFLIALHDQHQNTPLVALTPTTYPLKNGSIYAPVI